MSDLEKRALDYHQHPVPGKLSVSSTKPCLTQDDLSLANPDPEVLPSAAYAIRNDIIMATGRSDFPNQVNNALCFPYLFRGALNAKAKQITEKMKVAAAKALSELAHESVPEAVLKAYNLTELTFGSSYIIPKPFDPRLLEKISTAVKEAALSE